VKNFAQMKVGDQVTVEYVESLALELKEGRRRPGGGDAKEARRRPSRASVRAWSEAVRSRSLPT